MARFHVVAVACFTLLAAAPTAWGLSYYEHHTYRTIASPGPVAGIGMLSDTTTYRLVIPAGVAVSVLVTSDTSLFHLRSYEQDAAPSPFSLPAFQQGLTFTGPRTTFVEVDPVAGRQVDILATFRGHVSAIGGARAEFEMRVFAESRACVEPEVCLS